MMLLPLATSKSPRHWINSATLTPHSLRRQEFGKGGMAVGRMSIFIGATAPATTLLLSRGTANSKFYHHPSSPPSLPFTSASMSVWWWTDSSWWSVWWSTISRFGVMINHVKIGVMINHIMIGVMINHLKDSFFANFLPFHSCCWLYLVSGRYLQSTISIICLDETNNSAADSWSFPFRCRISGSYKWT